MRLKDLEGLEQEECAGRMEISRQTFQRVLASARRKIACALLTGKALRIEGGNYELAQCCLDRIDKEAENIVPGSDMLNNKM